jgi:hypothetical protein
MARKTIQKQNRKASCTQGSQPNNKADKTISLSVAVGQSVAVGKNLSVLHKRNFAIGKGYALYLLHPAKASPGNDLDPPNLWGDCEEHGVDPVRPLLDITLCVWRNTQKTNISPP